MMTSKTTRPSISKTDKNWYTNDEISLIKKAAFDKGVEHFTQTYLDDYNKNIVLVQHKVSQFFTKLAIEYPEVKISQIKLKPSSIDSFELIFLVPEEDFINEEKHRFLFTKGNEFIDAEFSADIFVTLLYMPYNGNANDNEFRLNGYCFTYDPHRTK
jgi:hypothetical protein